MRGQFVFSQRDVEAAPEIARSRLHTDSIAVGDYGPNCHGTGHEGSLFGGVHSGEFYLGVSPYQIPYGVMLPPNLDNLLVCCAISSTHVGFCSLRFEPIWSALGEAAGRAIALARAQKQSVQQVSVKDLQRTLHRSGAATVYFSDLPAGHPDFANFQWWGTLGGFHALAEPLPQGGTRGAPLVGQYFEAFAAHAAQPQKLLTESEQKQWQELAIHSGIASEHVPQVRPDWTRAGWIRTLREQLQSNRTDSNF